MKLLTKEIEKKLEKHPIYSQDGKGDNADIIVKFFNPMGKGTWYVLEGEKQADGDWLFYGIVDLYCREYGSFLLSELESIRLPFGLGIERDLHFNNKKVADIKKW